MSANTRAADLFAELRELGQKDATALTKYVEKWVADKQMEDEYLDFKTSAHSYNDPKVKDKDAKDAETWSKTLASFANTSGGLVVWGINAKGEQQPDGKIIDAATNLKPLANTAQFVQFLKNKLRDSTNEPIPGIDHIQVPESSGAGGYVVSLVPEGPNKPYRAMRLPGQPYVFRIGDTTEIIPHNLLRLMFFPRVRPSFQIVGRPGKGEEIDIAIRNVGTATAKNMTVVVTYSQQWVSVTHSHPDWTVISDKNGVGNYVAVRPLHPEQAVELIRFHYTKEWEGRARPVMFGFRIYADDNASRLEWRVDESREQLMSEVYGYEPQEFTA